MNRGIAKGKEEGVEGCEGLYQSVSPQQASQFSEIKEHREGKKEKIEQEGERGAKEGSRRGKSSLNLEEAILTVQTWNWPKEQAYEVYTTIHQADVWSRHH